MFRLRALARPAQRAFSASFEHTTCQTSKLFGSKAALRPSNKISTFPRLAACFSTTRSVNESEGDVNVELAAKLASELQLEQGMRDSDSLPEHLKEFIDNTPFKLQDTPGSEEVAMTRKYGDESIRVTFSIADLNNVDEDADMHDNALEDEYDDPSSLPSDTQSGGATSKGAINQGRTSGGNFKIAPEDSIAESDNPGTADQQEGSNEPSFPARVFVTVERVNKGMLQIEAIAQDGLMVIDNVYFFKDGKLADPTTVTDQKVSERLYTGPPFGNLDEDLQVLFENYLAERGINTTMALFVPEYIDYKEQKEYLIWLGGVKNFVE